MAKPSPRKLFQIIITTGMLLTGSINILTKKAQNDFVVPGVAMPTSTNSSHTESKPHAFDHPWFQTCLLVTGEFICLVALLIQRWFERHRHRNKFGTGSVQNTSEEILVQTEQPFHQPRICQPILLIPAAMHLISNSLGSIGLVLVSAFIWQMLRGCIIIFTGICAIIFLKKKLFCVHWTGILVTMFGLCLVGLSGILEEPNNRAAHEIMIGILCILASQAIQALQITLEEKILKHRGYHPLHVVSMKGVYGMMFMCTILLPVLYFIPDKSKYSHRYEDTLDALIQIKSNYKLLALCLGYIMSVAVYNFCSMSVTKSLSAVHNTLINACRTILIWSVSLLIYYFVDENFGDPFSTTWGILQIDGFVFLVIGTLLYNEVMDTDWIPGCQRTGSRVEPETSEPIIENQSTGNDSVYGDPQPETHGSSYANHLYINAHINGADGDVYGDPQPETHGSDYENPLCINADINGADGEPLLK